MTVNVHTEWGQLKEIVVGNCINISKIENDKSFQLFFHENIKDELIKNSFSLQKKIVDERQEDLDNLAKTLQKNSIKVLRPKQLNQNRSFTTPEFTEYLSPVDNPRDQTLIIGNEIIETSCQWRRRYFENDLMKDIFREYFKSGSKWTVAPKPSLSVNSFDFRKILNTGSEVEWEDYLNDQNLFEIMFDGAQCLRFGQDIVMNVSTENHKLGAIWLERHLGHKYNIHQVTITDNHIDGMFMPLRPGVLLINPNSMYKKIEMLPKALQKWDHLIVPDKHKEHYPKESVLLASSNINVNVLSLNETDVLVFDEYGSELNPLVKTLERKSFNPIPIKFRHSRLFGGGLHCATLDMVREDKYENFFS